MVGYAQQDAHEFLLALLNGMDIQLKALEDFRGVCLDQVSYFYVVNLNFLSYYIFLSLSDLWWSY